MREITNYCQAVTNDGDRCKNRAKAGSDFCHIHDKNKVSDTNVEANIDKLNWQQPITYFSANNDPRRYSMKNEFEYMGKKVKIGLNKAGDVATIKIEDREFKAMLHTEGKPEDNYIKLWRCENAYNMTETPEEMAKHIITYWHQYN